MVLLYEIEVAADRRLQGAGRALMSALLDLCARERAAKLWVLTDPANAAACGLYAAMGGDSDPNSPAALYVWSFSADA